MNQRMTFSVHNLGCKVNAYECECVAEQMEDHGFIRVENDPQIVILMTCAVTNTAAAKSRRVLHHMKRLVPDAVIAVAGCSSAIDPDSYKEADVLVGTAHKSSLCTYIEQFLETKEAVVDPAIEKDRNFDVQHLSRSLNRARANLKIQDGCDQFCSYCIIPYARGRERSMPVEEVLRQARQIAKDHPELILTGIHTGRYGRELNSSLSLLMRRILKEIPDVKRLRISSIEVSEIDEDLLDLLQTEKRVARHLHIPLQSGCDSVLARMNRPYGCEEYYAKIKEIKRRVPGISISTDVITGFPGETDEEFKKTVEFIMKCEFSFLHVFPYSMREGTRAAKMCDQIDPQLRKKRAAELMKLSRMLQDRYESSFVGRIVDVYFERGDTEYTNGHTSEYLQVKVSGQHAWASHGMVRIVAFKDHQLYGERQDL